MSAPTSALAGRMRVASAEFEGPAGTPLLEVPVEMTVLDVHRIELTVIDQLVGGKRGDVATIRYRAVNFGNVPDSVSLAVQLPEGWKLSSGVLHSVHLGVHAAQDGVIRFWIPPGAAPGTQIVHVVASSGGAVVSAADIRVEVENPFAASQQQGPRLSLGTAVSSMQQGPSTAAYIGSLEGNVADSVSVLASGVWRANSSVPNASSDLALMRLGVPTLPPSFSIRSPSLRFGVGLTGGTLSDLTGAYVTGTGVSAGASVAGWTVSGVEARPYQYGGLATSNSTPGTIGEARIDRSVDSGSVFVVATHLVDPTQLRQLDATSIGAAFGSTPFGQVSSEVGYRRFDGGQGVGASGEMNRQGDDGGFSLRVLHAPGGAKAFARATDEITTSAQRNLSDWMNIGGGMWRTSDASSTLGATSGLGWNVGPTFTLHSLGGNLSVQARGSSLDVTGQSGDFGDHETGIATTASVRGSTMFANGSLTLGTVTRTTGNFTPETGDNVDARATVGAMVNTGSVQFDAGVQGYSGGAAIMPLQTSVGIRAEHVALPIGDRWHVYAGGEIQRLSFSVGGNPALSQRYMLSIPVGLGVEISAVAERNPFYTMSTNGRIGWITAIRVDQSRWLPRLFSPGETHVVYRDVNGNGRRDRGEDGVAGIVITCGEQTVVTDKRGRFKCPSTASFAIDPRSLPLGWIAPGTSRGSQVASDVGLIAMTAVRVQFDLANVDTLRVSRADLAKLVVVARDSANQPWVARDVGSGDFVFDALPPGQYVIEVDASGIEEPLAVADRVQFSVGSGDSPKVRVPLRGRATRVRMLPPTQSDGNSTAGGGPKSASQGNVPHLSPKESNTP